VTVLGPARVASPRLAFGRSGESQQDFGFSGVEKIGGRVVVRGPVNDGFSQPAPRGLDRAHFGQQLAGGGPLARVLGQAAADQRPDLVRQQIEAGWAVDQPVNQRRVGPGPERPLARTGKGQDRAEAENIAGRSDVLSQDLLGGHEPGRADHHVRTGDGAGLGGFGDPEVDDSRSVLCQQHIGGLQVTVHDPCDMDRVQALGQTRRQSQQGIRRQRSVLAYRLGQGGSRNIGRGQPWHRSVQIGVDHQRREQAAHLPGCGDLAPEPGPELGIVSEFFADNLDRDRPAAR
jgi:hypothetical protein